MKHPNIVIGDHQVCSCESYKYLGIHFDKKDEHIDHVTAKLAQHSGILYKLRATLNEKQLIQYIYITDHLYHLSFSMAFFCMGWPKNQIAQKFRNTKRRKNG